MTKPKVLLLLHDLTLTGSPKVALDVFERLGERVELRVVAPEDGPLAPRCQQIGPLSLLRPPVRPRPRPRLNRRIVAQAISLSLQQWKPDLIYANSLAVMHLVHRLRLPAAPVLWHIHEMETSFVMEMENFAQFLDWPQRFIAVSTPVQVLLTEQYGIDLARVTVIHEMVREEDYLAPPAVDTGEGPFIVGGAGQPQWRKGTTLWLQTAAALKKMLGPTPSVGGRPLRFVWVGTRDNLDSHTFQTEARKQKVDDLVEFVPATLEPYPQFARFDVFAMTSWEDPCPVVVLENMMLGKPVLCFADGGGAPEEVGETGVVVADFDPAAMAQAIIELAAAPDRCRTLGTAARARIGQHFTTAQQVPKIWREIEGLVAAHRSPAPLPRRPLRAGGRP